MNLWGYHSLTPKILREITKSHDAKATSGWALNFIFTMSYEPLASGAILINVWKWWWSNKAAIMGQVSLICSLKAVCYHTSE